jgi:NADPH-dependent 2,4-dienoyl-CoA reductase/sulfur reductase-like enzyme/nitrite reductase/ring-hydroxylating ferredoxin subunit
MSTLPADTGDAKRAEKPDLTDGIAAASLADGAMLVGRVGKDDVLLAHAGHEWFAVGAHCTHYKGPLVKGLIVGDTVRCPLHHACFSLRTGEALRAPAFDPIACWRVEHDGDRVVVREKVGDAASTPRASGSAPSSIAIVGGGAAGFAAADMLRREGYDGPIAMISADRDAPVDRPNLSKDYLAGKAQDDWMPLWSPEQYAEHRIELVTGRRVTALDPGARSLSLDDGSTRSFGALLLATGAEPVRLSFPGASSSQVLYLRTYADARAIVAQATTARHVVVAGASFIGLEVAASLRARNVEVDVVAPDKVPMERVLGADVGRFVQSLHEAHGVRFHLGETIAEVAGRAVTLSGGGRLEADCVVMGVGVKPSTALAEAAGLTLDRGIVVDQYLETSAPGIFAAGDVARWPDPHTGDRIRVEHWVVAERQGQAAARNMLGRREPFDAVPFFWSRHYDIAVKYVGHAEQWDAAAMEGSLEARSWTVTYSRGGRRLAVATLSRDRDSLAAEAQLEREGR